jgi:hypothetical protein
MQNMFAHVLRLHHVVRLQWRAVAVCLLYCAQFGTSPVHLAGVPRFIELLLKRQYAGVVQEHQRLCSLHAWQNICL